MEKCRKAFNILIKSIMTGICIAIGGIVYLSCDNKYIGAFLFGTGLFIVLNFGCLLYTGKVGYLINNKPSYLFTLIYIWFGNFIGAVTTALVITQTRISGISEKVSVLVDTKLNDAPISIFFLSVFCGMLMYIAAEGYKRIDNPVGKNLATFLPVVVFILCGFEHCVANMFYFAAAQEWSLKMFAFLGIMTIGNSVGGISCNLLMNCQKNEKLRRDNSEKRESEGNRHTNIEAIWRSDGSIRRKRI